EAAWIRRQLGDARAVRTDVTSGAAVLGVMGPRARAARAAHRRRSLERGVSVPRLARDLAGLRAGSRDPRYLRWRAGVGALRRRRVRGRSLRRAGGGGGGPRAASRRVPRDGLAAARESLSLVGPRPRQRGHALRGGPR